MATKQFLRGAAAIAAVVALALALTTIVAASSSSPAAPPPVPAPDPKQEWRVCDDSAVKKHAFVVESVCVNPWPIATGKSWSLDVELKHHGQHEVRDAEFTLKVFALQKLPVYSTTEDFCKSSKKKHEAALVNMLARAAAMAAGNDDGKKGGKSGCPLKAGETTRLHFEGDWSAWAPESDKYRLRVVVKDRERPDPQSELMCIDVDVVARKPPSASSVAAS